MGRAGCSDGGSAGHRARMIGWLNNQRAGFTENPRNSLDVGWGRTVELGSSTGLVDRLTTDILHLLTWPIDSVDQSDDEAYRELSIWSNTAGVIATTFAAFRTSVPREPSVS